MCGEEVKIKTPWRVCWLKERRRKCCGEGRGNSGARIKNDWRGKRRRGPRGEQPIAVNESVSSRGPLVAQEMLFVSP